MYIYVYVYIYIYIYIYVHTYTYTYIAFGHGIRDPRLWILANRWFLFLVLANSMLLRIRFLFLNSCESILFFRILANRFSFFEFLRIRCFVLNSCESIRDPRFWILANRDYDNFRVLGGTVCLMLLVQCGLVCLMRASSCQGSSSSATLLATFEEHLC